jgi:hypothetical protein
MKLLNTPLRWILSPFLRPFLAMPGKSHQGALPPLTEAERQILANAEAHVRSLSEGIGERSVRSGLEQAADYVLAELYALGYTPGVHEFTVDGHRYRNIDIEIRGAAHPDQIVVVGAHYDTVFGSPGADDNATGVAALFELARLLKDSKPDRTLRMVFFANEEHPLHQSAWESMGSFFYARACRERGENVVAMLVLEMLGVYSDAEGSQSYPYPFSLFYPSRGNFVAFVGNYRSRSLVRRCLGSFRSHTAFPSEGGAPPELFRDIGRSDHWSFWQFGYPGVMVTDTSNFRYRHYHTSQDTPDKLDFERLARVTAGLARTVSELADA